MSAVRDLEDSDPSDSGEADIENTPIHDLSSKNTGNHSAGNLTPTIVVRNLELTIMTRLQ